MGEEERVHVGKDGIRSQANSQIEGGDSPGVRGEQEICLHHNYYYSLKETGYLTGSRF